MAELEGLVRDLTARLGTNSTNSSVPPSANPLSAPKPVVKKKSRRKPGGQPGHAPHLKQLLPGERITTMQRFVPQHAGSEASDFLLIPPVLSQEFFRLPVIAARHCSRTARVKATGDSRCVRIWVASSRTEV